MEDNSPNKSGKKRKVLSVRRFKISADGTRQLLSVTSGFNTTTNSSKKPDESCAVEPFYVPVNPRKKNMNSQNFWDDDTAENTKNGDISLNISSAP